MSAKTFGRIMLLSTLVGAGCRNGDPAPTGSTGPAKPLSAWTPSRVAELYFSTEVKGYVEPCGCTTEPLGGVQRLAAVVGASDVPHGLVDAGNLLFPPQGLTEVTRQQHLLKSHILARAYRQIGVLAINVAEAELAEGASHLLLLQQEGAVPLVSANVRPKGNDGPTIARSFVRTLGKIKFGITGVATPEEVARASKDVTVIEYVPSLRNEITALRKSSVDVVVVLAHVGDGAALELARLIPEIDIIVRAPGTPIEREPAAPKQVGGVLVVEAGSQGQRIGRIRFSFDDAAPERPLRLDDGGAKSRQAQARLQMKLETLKVQRDAWKADPKKAAAVAQQDQRIAALEAQLGGPVAASRPPDAPHVRVDVVPLTAKIEGDPTIMGLLAGYYQQLQKMNWDKGDPEKCKPVSDQAPKYVGTKQCADCHEEAFEFWQKTKHAEAWETLEKDGKHFDLTCVGCHVVGYQEPGGFCRLRDVAGFEDVGCENCHGPGSRHVDSEDPDDIVLKTTQKTCAATCHVPEHSDAFEYDSYLKKITGPGHELSDG